MGRSVPEFLSYFKFPSMEAMNDRRVQMFQHSRTSSSGLQSRQLAWPLSCKHAQPSAGRGKAEEGHGSALVAVSCGRLNMDLVVDALEPW